MKVISKLALIALAFAAADAKTFAEYETEFLQWMETHQLSFPDVLEYAQRLETYISNDIFISEHNALSGKSFTLGHNAFSHMNSEEFRAKMNGFVMPEGYLESRLGSSSRGNYSESVLPESIDWVKKGGVTDVKNQGQCGSCWAFSTTGAVEGAAFVAGGKLPSLSEQELVDCDNNDDHGCNGGLMDHAFTWVREHGGLCSEQEYAYHAKKEQCAICHPVVKVTGFTDVDPMNEKALQAAVAMQPVSVAIEADQRGFQLYKSGVFDAECGAQLDHGVLVVGYGQEDGKKFWKVKNSWGGTWGEQGYIRLAREIGVDAGQCGVASVPSYPSAKWINTSEKEMEHTEQAVAISLLQAVEEADRETGHKKPHVYEYMSSN